MIPAGLLGGFLNTFRAPPSKNKLLVGVVSSVLGVVCRNKKLRTKQQTPVWRIQVILPGLLLPAAATLLRELQVTLLKPLATLLGRPWAVCHNRASLQVTRLLPVQLSR